MTIQDLIYQWENAAGFDSPDVPRLPHNTLREFRMRLIDEEADELSDAFEAGDLVEVADALGDIIWVVYGTAHACGIDLDDIVREVGRSNYTKLVDGPESDRGGKIQKGPNYEPPKIMERLLQQAKRGVGK